MAGVEIEQLIPFAFFALFGGFFAVAVVAARRNNRRMRENLARMAARLGLNAELPQKPRLLGSRAGSVSGVYRGWNMRIFTYTTGSGKNRTQWCAISIPVRNPAGLKLRISRENVFTRAGRALGIEDVAVGDRVFDREFYVKSNKPDFIRAALIPEFRHRLAELWRKGARGTLSAEGAEVKYAETGSFAQIKLCDRLVELVEAVCDMGEVVEACRE